MVPPPRFTTALARLVPGDARPARTYRPWITGPAILRRPCGAAAWSVALACDERLVPLAPRLADDLGRLATCLAGRGIACRVGAALAGPLDWCHWPGSERPASRAAPTAPSLRLDIYGWALMYQPPGTRGEALVDADDRFADLPVVFELPLELIDRAEFLEARGFRTRPFIVPTRPEDFERDPDGRLRNRFFPEADFRSPCRVDLLL